MSDIETISPRNLIMDKTHAYWRVKAVNRLRTSEPHIIAEMCDPACLFGALSVTAVFTCEALKAFQTVETS